MLYLKSRLNSYVFRSKWVSDFEIHRRVHSVVRQSHRTNLSGHPRGKETDHLPVHQPTEPPKQLL